MANKSEFRAFQRDTSGLSSPPFAVGTEFETVYLEALEVIDGPLVIKPADSSGSRGVTSFECPDADQCRTAFLAAAAFSPTSTVCIEAYVGGEDVSGDAFLIDGRPWATITRKFSSKFVPTGHRVPTHLSDGDIERVLDEVQRTCAALGYRNGPLDFDVKVSPTTVTIIELSARLGGNGIPALIEHATGVDLVTMTVDHALGQPPPTVPSKIGVIRPCGSYVFGSPQDGVLTSVVTADELRQRVPEVFEYRIHRTPGSTVRAFEHSGNSVGHVLFGCGPPDTYESVLRRVKQALDLTVRPSEAPVGGAVRR
jgi:biotin carboxylase